MENAASANLTRVPELSSFVSAAAERIGNYVRRWQRWLVSGLGPYRVSVLSLLPGACRGIG
jgi:hypothetical protein